MPVWRAIGKTTRWLFGPALPKTLAISATGRGGDCSRRAWCRPISRSKATASCGRRCGKTCLPSSTAKCSRSSSRTTRRSRKASCWSSQDSRDLEKEIGNDARRTCARPRPRSIPRAANRSTTMKKSSRGRYAISRLPSVSQLEAACRQPAKATRTADRTTEAARDPQPDRRPGGRVAAAREAAWAGR